MAISELLGASLLMVGYPGETIDSQSIERAEVSVVSEANEYAVLPKVLKIAGGEIYWIEQ